MHGVGEAVGFGFDLEGDALVRVASISSRARAELRYALARLDSLRAVAVEFEIESVVGRQMTKVEIPSQNPLAVRLHLDDCSTIELLQHPTSPDAGPARPSLPGRS